MHDGFKLNMWDIGGTFLLLPIFDDMISHRSLYLLDCALSSGQKSIRPYWRNYFDQTDALVWLTGLDCMLAKVDS